MAYYTERHGMRKPIAKTYDISIEKYALLLHCCECVGDPVKQVKVQVLIQFVHAIASISDQHSGQYLQE